MKFLKIFKFMPFYFLICISVTGAMAFGDAPLFSESLIQVENRGRDNSGTLKAAQETQLAAQDQAESNEASLYPRLTFEGTYFYQTNVPAVSFSSFGLGGAIPPLSFGSNSNYAIGPALYYTLFDGGQNHRQWKSSESLARARSEDFKTNEKQLQLNLRLAYFKLQLSLKNLALTSDSLELSQAQDHDIHNRFKAGAASRLDAVNSHREVLTNQLLFRQAQNDLAASVRDLFALTGDGQSFDTSRPVPANLTKGLPDGVEAPSLRVQIDSIESTLQSLSVRKFQKFDPEHPEIKSLAYAAEASRLASDAQESELWPKLQFSARSEVIYPNLILPEAVGQNIFTVTLSMPLFEASLSRNLAQQHMKESLSSEYQRQQKITDLTRDWNKARDLLESLRSQEQLSEENSKEAAEAARLTYQSYKAGKQEYLDVESANVRLLQAQVNAAQVKANMLNTIAQLDFLSSQ